MSIDDYDADDRIDLTDRDDLPTWLNDWYQSDAGMEFVKYERDGEFIRLQVRNVYGDVTATVWYEYADGDEDRFSFDTLTDAIEKVAELTRQHGD